MSRVTPRFGAAAVVAALAALAGCPSDPSLTCVQDVDFSTCPALYQPTWSAVYENTVVRSCSTGGVSCHAAAGAQGGLVLEGSDQAYLALTAGHRYLTPGDAACSELVERLYSPNPDLVMPRGARLSDPEACAIGKWVAAGAPGPVDLVDAGVDAPSSSASGATP
ncbi:MAG TPA: c-type cytochrome domain-containing protein [Kofleriaceae bacterium]|nr:c-type cytochrome domain-containing protein [Kofleriaceae bacterium]